MERSNSYKDLIAWQQAMDLAVAAHHYSADFPKSERFGMTSQMRRCASSVPSNIAEGQGRNSKGEFLQFLGHARGSLYELETQTLLTQRFGFGEAKKRDVVLGQCDRVARLLNGLMQSLREPCGPSASGREKRETRN
jgi:four helix bundle protein